MLTFDDVLISENGAAGGVFLSAGAAAGRVGTGSVDDDDDDGAGSVKSLLTNCIMTKNRLANRLTFAPRMATTCV